MSATETLPYRRYLKQAKTGEYSVLSAETMGNKSLELMQAVAWAQTDTTQSTFPPRAEVLVDGTLSPSYDAASYCGDYSGGNQLGYATAVAYRMRVPAEALTGTVAEVVSVDIPLFVDRWLVAGARLAAVVSADSEPTEVWATIRAGDVSASAQLPMVVSPARVLEEKDAVITLTMPASTTAEAYIYIFLTLEDYDTARGFWLEGAAFLDCDSASVTFNRSVTADSVTTEDPDYYAVTLTKPFLVDASTETIASVFANNGTSLDVAIGTGGTDRHVVNNVKTALAQETTAAFETVTALAATWNRSPSGAATDVRIKGALQSLSGGLITGGTASRVVFADALPEYPDWLRVRMNLYLCSSTYIASVASVFMKDLGWIAGTYSANGMTNILSETLSPLGYGAGSQWIPEGVAIAGGRLDCFLSFQILNIVADPPSTTDSALGFSMTPTFIRLEV